MSLGVQSLYKFQSRALLLSLISPPSRKCLCGYHLNLYHSDEINGSGQGNSSRLISLSLSLSPVFTVFDSVRRSMRAPLLFCFRLFRWKVKIFPGKKAIYRFFYLDSVNYGLFFSFWITLFVSLGCLR